MSFGSPRPHGEGRAPIRLRPVHVAGWILALVAAASFAISADSLMANTNAGLDLTDEGHYLLAADNHQPAAAFNGLFGKYTGLVYRLVGYDLGTFRMVAIALAIIAGMLFGFCLFRLVERSAAERWLPTLAARITVSLGVACGALIEYNLFIRTPGYNWLTLEGLLLAAAGISLQLSNGPLSRLETLAAVILIGLGAFLALAGKIPAGVAVILLVAGATLLSFPTGRHARVWIGVWAAALLVGFIILHVVFIEGAVPTINTIRNDLAMLAIVDPVHYQIGPAIQETLRELAAIPGAVIGATRGTIVLATAPLLAGFLSPGKRSLGTTVASIGALTLVTCVLVAAGDWVGGVPSYGANGLAAASVAATGAIAASCALAVRWRSGELAQPGAWSTVLSLGGMGVVLLGAAGAYAFGSNNGFVAQASGATVLTLSGSAALLAAGLAPPFRTAAPIVMSIVMAVAASSVISTARAMPYRIAGLDSAVSTISFGPHRTPIDLDPAAARYWAELELATAAGGWRPGTAMLDLTWSPAVPYDLEATVPAVLLPTVGNARTGTASAIEALQLSGDTADWRSAWLLTSPDLNTIDVATVMHSIGRNFPGDYDLVLTVRAPGLGVLQELWRPSVVNATPEGPWGLTQITRTRMIE